MAKGKQKKVIGLTLDAAELRAVELSGSWRQPQVTASGCAALPQGLLSDGLLTDLPAAGELLRGLLRENGFSRAPIIVGAKNQNVLLRMASFPKVPADKMRNAVLYQAQQYIPIPVSELELDFVECGDNDEEEHPAVNLLLVGAKKAFLSQMIEMIELAGQTVLDIDAALLANVRAATDSLPAGQGVYLLADVDHETLGMMIVRGEEILMARTAALSPRFAELAPGLHSSLALSEEQLEELAGLLERDLRASLQYFGMRSSGAVEKVYITGRFAQMARLAERISALSEAPVELPRLYPELAGQIDTIAYAGCISLARRGLEG